MALDSALFDFEALDAQEDGAQEDTGIPGSIPEPCLEKGPEDAGVGLHAGSAVISDVSDGDSDETLSEVWPGEILGENPFDFPDEIAEHCDERLEALEALEKLEGEVPLWEVLVTRVLVRSAPSLDAAPVGFCSQRELVASERDDPNPDWVKLIGGRGFILKDGSKKEESLGMLLKPVLLRGVPAEFRCRVSCLLRDAWVEARSHGMFIKPRIVRILRQAADDCISGAAGGAAGEFNVDAFADMFVKEVRKLLDVENQDSTTKAAPPSVVAATGGGVPATKYQPSVTRGTGGRMSMAMVREMMLSMKQRRLPSTEDVVAIITQASALFAQQPSLVELRVPATATLHVVGDIHGQYWDLLHMMEVFGEPSGANLYLFNGDFVDRGAFSFEVAISLLAMKVAAPSAVHMNRGNHESFRMNAIYGFMAEVNRKYQEEVFSLFSQAFQCLPLATVVNQSVFVVHGGLGSCEKIQLNGIAQIDRKREPDENAVELMLELLWSDPMESPGVRSSPRGGGVLFGPDVTQRFCSDNGLLCIIRSHEMKPEGFEWHHSHLCLTVFSAPNYCGICGNLGAVCDITPRCRQLRLDHSDLQVRTFESTDHPADVGTFGSMAGVPGLMSI